MLNLIILLPIFQAYIFSDQGYFKNTNFQIDSQFSCYSNYKNNYLIPFTDNFLNIPQITFFWKLLDLYYQPSEFQLDISNINTKNFTLTIKCPLYRVYGVEIQWFAIDDQRIEIISLFNANDLQPKMTFEHKNPNAEFGILIPTSIAQSGPFNLSIQVKYMRFLQITEITPNNVSIEINNLIENKGSLNQIGFQIILGPTEAFTIIENRTLLAPYQSDQIQKQPQSWIFVVIEEFIYRKSGNLYYLVQWIEDQSTISYQFPQWGIFSHIKIKSYWITYKLANNYIRLQLQKLEIVQNRLQVQQTTSLLQIEIFTQQNQKQIFNSTGIYSLLIEKFTQLLTFKISYICQYSEIVESNFQNGNGTFNNSYSHTYNCNIQTNQIIYTIQFNTQYGVYQQLILNFTNQNFLVEQILYNQVKTQDKLLEIKIF
ncbi:unnamed protein product [Paramecium pentaurelia]|uniref:H-type lectin domain-containing protein n=1 Tax=Paramecium pentaurelia TaxID=43138 RepID=A0A8S1YPZ3_9CILI|nr:unnamed protein product [Paramecium pentaurelia]